MVVGVTPHKSHPMSLETCTTVVHLLYMSLFSQSFLITHILSMKKKKFVGKKIKVLSHMR
jgi:hypothetical protein